MDLFLLLNDAQSLSRATNVHYVTVKVLFSGCFLVIGHAIFTWTDFGIIRAIAQNT